MKIRVQSDNGLAPPKLVVGVHTIAVYDDDDKPLLLWIKLPGKAIICYDVEDNDLPAVMKTLGINLDGLNPIPVTKLPD